jgi:hypothetical protein
VATLSAVQIYAYAREAGLAPSAASIATAIALAESSGRSDARSDVDLTEPGEVSVGLWQINYRPSRDRGNALRDPQKNLDPAHNAKAMASLSRSGRSWQPWTTYTAPGAPYIKHTAAAEKARQEAESKQQQAVNAEGRDFGWRELIELQVDPFDVFPRIGRDGGVPAAVADATKEKAADAWGALTDRALAGVGRIALVGVLVTGGVALVVAGIWRGVAPAVQKQTAAATDAAAAVAMVTPQGRAAGGAKGAQGAL